MRRSLVVILAVAALGVGILPASGAPERHTTYAMTDCLHVRVEPSSILFACGDGNYFVDHLTWDRWRTWKASGSGLFHLNDCRPSCAEGTFHTVRGHLWLRNREWCPREKSYVFQHVRVLYDGTLLGRHKGAFGHLGCPL